MKKPIDPNLNSIGEDDLLFGLNQDESKSSEDAFSLVQKPDAYGNSSPAEKKDNTVSVQDIMNEVEPLPNRETTVAPSFENAPGAEYHHSSSSSHHHHSSSSSHHHHSSSGNKSGKKKKNKLPVAARIAILILLFLLIAIIAAISAFLIMKSAGHKDIMPVISEDSEYQETIEYNGHTYKYNEDIFSMAFIGVDQRDMETVDETDFVGAADADIVVTVDTKTGKSKVIAIPRDTMVDVDQWSKKGVFLRTENMQLCLAYSYGDGAAKSCNNSVNAISRILYNVPIQKYFALDLDGIAPLNDAIGGVTVESLYKFPSYNVEIGDTVTLKGNMAEAYVRTRDMDKVTASLNRTDRQIQYVKAFSQQAVPAVIKDFSVISKLYNTASKYSQTNLTLNNATYLGSLLLSKGITEFETYTLKGKMKSSDDAILPDVAHAEFYPDEDYLMQTVLDVFYVQID